MLWWPVSVTRLPPPPVPPTPPPSPSFPLIATLAPLGGALLIGALTGSPFVLVFAVLSPVIAVATMLDGRRVARRQAASDAARFDEECQAYGRLIDQAHRQERAEQDARFPARPGAGLPPEREGAPVRIGLARQPSARAPESAVSTLSLVTTGPEGERVARLLDRARVHPALPLVVPRGVLTVLGAGAAARAMRERLSLEPGVTLREASLPSEQRTEGESETGPVIDVVSAHRLTVTLPGGGRVEGRPEFWSAPERSRLRAALRADAARIPDHVLWSELERSPEAEAGIPIGLGEGGPVMLDPPTDGPHLLMGGTTGSGKSEFLRTLVLGWAYQASPAELALLFVDFKGGASFLDLDALPHALEVITDLDESTADRALSSLRAEIRRRESWLRDRGARDVRDSTAALGRLVVVIDEYAALLATLPDLHGVIMDIAARGRSLGIHLVLCTQHPASAVRDAIAANCAIRVCFRIAEDADAALLGSGLATRLRALPRGRALVSDADGVREVQTALIDSDSVRSVCERWRGVPGSASPWVPPLPERVSLDDLERAAAAGSRVGQGWAFGLVDRPERQARDIAVWDRRRDGPLAVLGGHGTGRTGALAAIAAAARRDGVSATVLSGEWPDAMATLRELADDAPPVGLLVADDLDALLRRAGDDRAELMRLWDDAASALRARDGAVIAAMAPGPGEHALLSGRFSSVLELGGARADGSSTAASGGSVEHRASPGRGRWRGSVVQIVTPPPLPPPAAVVLPEVVVPEHHPMLVVARQPRRVAEALARAHPAAVVMGAAESATISTPAVGLEPRIVLDDVEGWTAQWSMLQALRRTATVVLAGVGAPEVRSLLGIRESPPPLRPHTAEVWWLEPEEPLQRARWAVLDRGRGADPRR